MKVDRPVTHDDLEETLEKTLENMLGPSNSYYNNSMYPDLSGSTGSAQEYLPDGMGPTCGFPAVSV
jgi:hypothetical protein